MDTAQSECCYSILVNGYPVFVSHLQKLAEEEPVKQAAKIRGYVKIMKSFKFFSCLLAFLDLLGPVARLSAFLQGDATNLMMAKTSVDTTRKLLKSAAKIHSEELTSLINQAESAEENAVQFKGILLSDAKAGVAFVQTQKEHFASRITTALGKRFEKLSTDLILQTVQLLDVFVPTGRRMQFWK